MFHRLAQRLVQCATLCVILSSLSCGADIENSSPGPLGEFARQVTREDYLRGYYAGVYNNWDGHPKLSSVDAQWQLYDFVEKNIIKQNAREELVAILGRRHEEDVMRAYPAYSVALVYALLGKGRIDECRNCLLGMTRALKENPEHGNYYCYTLYRITRMITTSQKYVSIPPAAFVEIARNIDEFLNSTRGEMGSAPVPDNAASDYLFRTLDMLAGTVAGDELFASKEAVHWLLRISSGMPAGAISRSELSIISQSLLSDATLNNGEDFSSLSLNRIGGMLIAISRKHSRGNNQELVSSPLSVLILSTSNKARPEDPGGTVAEVAFATTSAVEAGILLERKVPEP